jgi:hypothetical protein
MEITRYRSYVIRAWQADEDAGAVARVVIEEVSSGMQVELRGDPATDLGRSIRAALAGRDAEAGRARAELVPAGKERPG